MSYTTQKPSLMTTEYLSEKNQVFQSAAKTAYTKLQQSNQNSKNQPSLYHPKTTHPRAAEAPSWPQDSSQTTVTFSSLRKTWSRRNIWPSLVLRKSKSETECNKDVPFNSCESWESYSLIVFFRSLTWKFLYTLKWN